MFICGTMKEVIVILLLKIIVLLPLERFSKPNVDAVDITIKNLSASLYIFELP